MVASLQKQTDSCDVRAIEVTVKKGDTVVNTAGAIVEIDGTPAIFRAVDIPAGALVLTAAMLGVSGVPKVGFGVTTTGVDNLALAAQAAGVFDPADVATDTILGSSSASKPVYIKTDDFTVAGDEVVLLITYILRGSSEYNI